MIDHPETGQRFRMVRDRTRGNRRTVEQEVAPDSWVVIGSLVRLDRTIVGTPSIEQSTVRHIAKAATYTAAALELVERYRAEPITTYRIVPRDTSTSEGK